MNVLMRLKKSELIDLYLSEQQRADEQFDRAETLEKEKEEIEEELDEKIGFEDTLDIARDLMELIKASRYKLSLGVESEREELEKLTEKLEEILA
jgi:beta-phosphoglucomutase-like phosphatase (HAD superfamily)